MTQTCCSERQRVSYASRKGPSTGPLLLALPAPKSTARIHHQKWTPGSATIYRHRLPPPDLRGFRPPLTDAVDKQLVVIATYLPTGEFELHGVVKNDSVVKAALAAYYTENKADVDAAQATAQQQSKEAQKHSAIEQAAAQA